MLHFPLDDIFKRKYTVVINKIQKTIFMSSMPILSDYIPELTCTHINIFARIYITNDSVHSSQDVLLNHHLLPHDNNFDLRNFKSYPTESFSLVLDNTKFATDHSVNLITENKHDKISGFSISMHDKSKYIDKHYPMVVFNDNSNPNEVKTYTFRPTKRSMLKRQCCNFIDTETDSVAMKLDSKEITTYNQILNDCVEFAQSMQSKTQLFTNLFEGIMCNENNEIVSYAQLLIEIRLHRSKTKKYYINIQQLTIKIYNTSFLFL